jgi:type III secretory pathway component EscV
VHQLVLFSIVDCLQVIVVTLPGEVVDEVALQIRLGHLLRAFTFA